MGAKRKDSFRGITPKRYLIRYSAIPREVKCRGIEGNSRLCGCPPGIRTPITCSRGRCPTIERGGSVERQPTMGALVDHKCLVRFRQFSREPAVGRAARAVPFESAIMARIAF